MQHTQPSAPSSPKPVLPAIVTSSVEPRTRHIKYASIGQQGRSTKTHARRRTERDQPNSLLLTPPLTPSSSIRTTASQSSSSAEVHSFPSSATPNDVEEIEDPDPKATRILLVSHCAFDLTSNISPTSNFIARKSQPSGFGRKNKIGHRRHSFRLDN